jgi:hypothetical protein
MGKLAKILIEAVVISVLVKTLSYVNWKKVGNTVTKDFRKKADEVKKDFNKNKKCENC